MTIQETARQAANRAFLSWEHNDAETLPMDDVADAVALAVLQEIAKAPYYEVNGDTKMLILKAIQELQK